MNKNRTISSIIATLLLASPCIRADMLYEFRFEDDAGKKTLVNTGTLKGNADDFPQDSTSVEFSHKTQSGTGVALQFPMAPDGTLGPILVLPNSEKILQMNGAQDELTIAMWIRWNGADKFPDNDLQVLVSKMSPSQDDGWAFGITDAGALKFLVGGYGARFTKDIVTAGKWTHIAMVYRPRIGLKLFMDGKEAALDQDLGASTVKANKELITVGATSGHYCPCNATIDELRIYDEAISSDDIDSMHIPTTAPAK